MKKIIGLALAVAIASNGFCQEKSQSLPQDSIPATAGTTSNKSTLSSADSIADFDYNGEKVYTKVDVVPEFPGGATGFNEFLKKNFRYPAKARNKNIQGRVELQFVVSKDGHVAHVEIFKDIGGGAGDEGKRMGYSMPKWKPGLKNGKPVNVLYKLPITFRLTE